mmetsp:Transcript_682/g.1297  ORF Transcript_682/g.1297 Transcript_682/m.1297 type:complete len:582 (-) Transcript_682:35-1780(-)
MLSRGTTSFLSSIKQSYIGGEARAGSSPVQRGASAGITGSESAGGVDVGAGSSFAQLAHALRQALDKSSTSFHVFCSDPVGINLAVFDLWLKGFREEQVVYYRRNLLEVEPEVPESELLLLLYRDAVDQYRLFLLVEEFLEQPTLFERQLITQVSPRTQMYLIQKYYEFDDDVIRELLGRKLTTRARKELDEVAETSNVLLASCNRQFDNLQRVFNAMDERNFEGNILYSIVEQFRFSWDLAERYMCLLFLLYNRFYIQTGRKKTGAIVLEDLEYCAALCLVHWVSVTSNETGARKFCGTHYLNPLEVELDTIGSGRKTLETLPKSVTDDGTTLSSAGAEKFDEEDRFSELDSQVDVGDDRIEDFASHPSTADELAEHEASTLRTTSSSFVNKTTLASVGKRISTTPFDFTRSSSVPGSFTAPKPGNTSMEISPSLIWNWRLIKNQVFVTRALLDNTCKAIQKQVCKVFQDRGAEQSLVSIRQLKPKFRSWLRSLLTIGSGLLQAKELRDLFEDVIVLLCEPLQQVAFPREEIVVLFECIRYSIEQLAFMKQSSLREDWRAYIHVMALITSKLFESDGSKV